MTQDLEVAFAELGMTQYLGAFLEQGFDSWDIILDITESDLDHLGVKLGHRRKLQRRIANARGIAPDAILASPIRSSVEEPKLDPLRPELISRHDVPVETVVQKRKYRRHPKTDENSPERPPSAYVLFSNKMREDLKGQNLSFTEIAKLVGENWQSISAEEKEPFERQAQHAKDKYNHELAEYKKTAEYRRYAQYLQEFKQKQASQSQVKETAKRPKLEPMRSILSGNGSSTSHATMTSGSGSGSLGGGSGSSSDSQPGSEPPPTRQQRGSVTSMTDLQFSTAAQAASSRQMSMDEPRLSPTLSQFDTGFATSPRDRQWGDPSRPAEGKHQNLPSLSDMFDRSKMAGMPHSSDDSSGYNNYPSGHHHHINHHHHHHHHNRHDRARAEGESVRRALPPALRHEHSSSNGGASTAYAGVPPSSSSSRSSKDASLPIHAMLSNKSSNSPSPPSYSQPPSKPLELEPRRPFSSHRSGGQQSSSNGNGFDPYPRAASPVDEEMCLADPPPPRDSSLPRPPPHSRQVKSENGLDGMSALLRAGEIVGRRHA